MPIEQQNATEQNLEWQKIEWISKETSQLNNEECADCLTKENWDLVDWVFDLPDTITFTNSKGTEYTIDVKFTKDLMAKTGPINDKVVLPTQIKVNGIPGLNWTMFSEARKALQERVMTQIAENKTKKADNEVINLAQPPLGNADDFKGE